MASFPAPASAEETTEERLSALEDRVARLESSVESKSSGGLVLFLFGVFCALWAQNTGRSPWLWFFLGLFFSVITGVVLLAKNANDRKRRPRGGAGEVLVGTGSEADEVGPA
jgi:hypothetical protein